MFKNAMMVGEKGMELGLVDGLQNCEECYGKIWIYKDENFRGKRVYLLNKKEDKSYWKRLRRAVDGFPFRFRRPW